MGRLSRPILLSKPGAPVSLTDPGLTLLGRGWRQSAGLFAVRRAAIRESDTGVGLLVRFMFRSIHLA